jgi:hypothetical protein
VTNTTGQSKTAHVGAWRLALSALQALTFVKVLYMIDTTFATWDTKPDQPTAYQWNPDPAFKILFEHATRNGAWATFSTKVAATSPRLAPLCAALGLDYEFYRRKAIEDGKVMLNQWLDLGQPIAAPIGLIDGYFSLYPAAQRRADRNSRIRGEDATLANLVALEFDAPMTTAERLEALARRGLTPTMMVQSSPGRHHVYWFLAEPYQLDTESRPRFVAMIKNLARLFGSDPAATSLSQSLRIIGSYHGSKRDEYGIAHQVAAVYYEPTAVYDLGEIALIAKQGEPERSEPTPLVTLTQPTDLSGWDALRWLECQRRIDRTVNAIIEKTVANFAATTSGKHGERYRRARSLGGYAALYPHLIGESIIDQLFDALPPASNHQTEYATLVDGYRDGLRSPLPATITEPTDKAPMFAKTKRGLVAVCPNCHEPLKPSKFDYAGESAIYCPKCANTEMVWPSIVLNLNATKEAA